MSLIEKIAKVESSIRKTMLKLPPELVIFLYSNSRKPFLSSLVRDTNFEPVNVGLSLKQELLGLTFRSPMFNAAGMFKSGDGYELAYKQGAGAFLAGTTTNEIRVGNKKGAIWHPFISYHSSGAASNWMGLPNEGHKAVAARLSKVEKYIDCPLGASIAADSGMPENDIMSGILNGFLLYEKANVDFIELNESCPNVAGHIRRSDNFLDASMTTRLVYISEKFLKKRSKNLPVFVKFSNDTDINLLPALIDLLVELGFDGINLGNTSTKYDFYRDRINPNDRQNYDYFTSKISGGLSGKILCDNSLKLATVASEYIAKKNFRREFIVIRTGGVSNYKDIIDSRKSNIQLNQWFTGYFEAFAKRGHKLYEKLYKHL